MSFFWSTWLVIRGHDPAGILRLKAYLGQSFHIKDLGSLKYFLGIEVARGPEGIFLNQGKYAFDILDDAGLLGAKPSLLPMEQNHRLPLPSGSPMADPARYRPLVGRLVYLTITRPDLSYYVHCLAQFMKSPTVEDWEAATRVVRYLKIKGQGVFF